MERTGSAQPVLEVTKDVADLGIWEGGAVGGWKRVSIHIRNRIQVQSMAFRLVVGRRVPGSILFTF